MATNVSMLFSPKISKLYMKDSGGTMREIAILYKGTTVAWKDGSVVSAAGMELLGTADAQLTESRIRGKVLVKSDDEYASLTKDANIFYAVYDTSVVVTLNLNGGTASQTSLKRKKGSTLYVKELPTPTRSGYVFMGWTSVNGDTSGNYLSSVYVSGAMTLHAYWINANPVPAAGTPTWGDERDGRKSCTYNYTIPGSARGVYEIYLVTDNGVYSGDHGAFYFSGYPDYDLDIWESSYYDPATGVLTCQSIWGYTATLVPNADNTFTFSVGAYAGETVLLISTKSNQSQIIYFGGSSKTGTVYWGDGTSEKVSNGSSSRKAVTHKYPALNETYVAKFVGNWTSIGAGYSASYYNKAQIKAIIAYGQTSMLTYAFAGQNLSTGIYFGIKTTLGTYAFANSYIDQIAMNGVIKLSNYCFNGAQFGICQVPACLFNSVTSLGVHVFTTAHIIGDFHFNAKLTDIGNYTFTSTEGGATFHFHANTKAQITGFSYYPFESPGNLITAIDSTGAQWTF